MSLSLCLTKVWASALGGLWEMNLKLFLLLALTASWTGLVQCEDKEETETEFVSGELVVVTTKAVTAEEDDPENHRDVAGSGDGRSQTIGASLDLDSAPINESASNEERDIATEADTEPNKDTNDLNTVIMILIPLVLILVIISMIVCLVLIYRRLTTRAHDTKEDPYLDDDLDHEKVPMPMFEDDIPSVMELEMEDLENWMAKDGGKKVDTGQI